MLGLFIVALFFLGITSLNLYVIIFSFIIYGVGFGIRIVIMSALAGDSVPPEDVGLAMALLFAATDTGSAVGSIIAGVASTFLPIPVIFQISAGMLLVVIPILSIIREK